MSAKTSLFAFLTIAALAGGMYYFVLKRDGQPGKAEIREVILDEAGFQPNELMISQGDIVVFKTTRGKEFWPASNLHPTHGIYPEFDPKQPIAPEESWTFRFDEVGEWKYHDHLAPNFRGVVKVVDKKKARSSFRTRPEWEEQIAGALETEGIDQAFQLVADLYAQEPVFAAECHGYVHRLGELTYEKFVQNKNVDLSAKSYYCGYGFYHGFMESLLLDTGDIAQAQQFCRNAGEKLAGQTSDAEGACYHGIGHGAVDGGDPRAWGDAEKMIEPGMKLCEDIAGHDRSQHGKLYRCTTGVYNAIEILSTDDKYGLASLLREPFAFCETQKVEYQEGCYNNMTPALQRLTKTDFMKSAAQIAAIPEQGFTIRSSVISGLFHEFIRVNLREPDYNLAEGVKLCRMLVSELRLACIDGLSGGHMKYGQPQQEYVKGLAFCASRLLASKEQDVCHEHILTRLRIWYSPEKSAEICAGTPKNYQHYCSRS